MFQKPEKQRLVIYLLCYFCNGGHIGKVADSFTISKLLKFTDGRQTPSDGSSSPESYSVWLLLYPLFNLTWHISVDNNQWSCSLPIECKRRQAICFRFVLFYRHLIKFKDIDIKSDSKKGNVRTYIVLPINLIA